MAKCRGCGARNPPNAENCYKCGASLADLTEESPKKDPKALVYILAILAVAMVIIAGAVYLSQDKGSDDSPTQYSVTIAASNNGYVVGAGSFDEGRYVTVVAHPDEGYKLTGWYLNGNYQSASGNRLSFYLEKDVLVQGLFSSISVDLTIENSTGGNCSRTGMIVYGSTITLEAHPSEGYIFGGWYEDGKLLSSDDVYSFILTKKTTIVPKWIEKLKIHMVMINPEAWDKAIPSQYVIDGGKLTDPGAVSRDGYAFAGWIPRGWDRCWDFDNDVVTEDMVLDAKWLKHFDISVTGSIATVTMSSEFRWSHNEVFWKEVGITDTISGSSISRELPTGYYEVTVTSTFGSGEDLKQYTSLMHITVP